MVICLMARCYKAQMEASMGRPRLVGPQATASRYSRAATAAAPIFEITPTGERRTLYNFCSLKKCADGALPNGSLVLGRNGNLYGTA